MAVLVLLLILGFGIRAYHLDAQALWSDEIHSTTFAAMSVPDLIRETRFVDPHPPLYYLTLKFWLKLVSDTDYTVRWPSVAGSVLAIPAGAVLARRIGGRTAGIIAALLLAGSPLLVLYAQEARMYGLLLATSTIATLRFHLAMERGSWRTWLAYALSALLALYSHYYAVPLIALHVFLAWRIFMFRPDRWRIITAFGLIGVGFGIWMYAIRSLGYEGWMEVVPFESAVNRSLWAFAVGTSVYPEQRWHLSLPILAAAGLGVIALAMRRQMGNLYLVAGGAIVPLILAYFLGALAGKAAYHERYVIAGAPVFVVAAGLGITWLLQIARWAIGQTRFANGIARRLSAALVVPLVAGLGGVLLIGAIAGDVTALRQHFGDAHFAKENLRELASYVSVRSHSEDGLIVSKERLHVYERYRREALPLLQIDLNWDEAERNRVLTAFSIDRDQIWMTADTGESDRRAWEWMDQQHFPLDMRWFGLAPLGSWLAAPDPPRSLKTVELVRGEALAQIRNAGFAMVSRANGARMIVTVGQWQRTRELSDVKASLRLVDRRGRIVASTDRAIGTESEPFGRWATTDARDVRLALRLPPGLPSGVFDLQLAPYDARGALSIRGVESGSVAGIWTLGSIDLPFVGQSNEALIDSRLNSPWSATPGLHLIGMEVPTGDVAAGSAVSVVLNWKGDSPTDLGIAALGATRLALGGSTDELAPDSLLTDTTGLSGALVWRETRTLRIPRNAKPGPTEIRLRARPGDANIRVLGSLQIVPGPALEPPMEPNRPLSLRFGPIRLRGYDVIGEPQAGSRLTIVLHEEAIDVTDRDLSVFVHVLAPDGRIIAQHDGAPCGGACPTSSWLIGDRFVDRHQMTIPSDTKAGDLRMVVGFYEPSTGVRVPLVDVTRVTQADSREIGVVTLIR